jgi:hypothetical protein
MAGSGDRISPGYMWDEWKLFYFETRAGICSVVERSLIIVRKHASYVVTCIIFLYTKILVF